VIAEAVVECLAVAVPLEVVQEEYVELLAVEGGVEQRAVPRQLLYD
jgi:hypothetical protein